MNDMVSLFNKGKAGKFSGLPTGIPKLDVGIYNIQQGMLYGIASSPKVGKSTFVDFAFMINPYLYAIEYNVDVKFFYWSLEMSKNVVRFKAAAHFFYSDYNISYITLPEGQTVNHSPVVPMQSAYLMGRMRADDNTQIKVSTEHEAIFKEIIEKRIIPMFGEYDDKGNKTKNGVVTIIEDKNDSNPTGIRNYLLAYAERTGKFQYEEYEKYNDITKRIEIKKRISGYIPNNPDKYTIIITDHLRALKRERQYTIKQNMDKLTEYQIFLRNICNYTFVDILHLNRSISGLERIKFFGNTLFPTEDDLKDSGNLSEDADYLITLFNPGNEKYGIKRHMNMDIEDIPNYRSIHVVNSRHGECPIHIQTEMIAGISTFKQL